jgi:hypothetical protein
MKKNAPHLTNKSLIALGELTGLSHEESIRNFLTNLTTKWPEGRQVIYDLLTHNDAWFLSVFTYTGACRRNNTTFYEIKLQVCATVKNVDKLKLLINKWSKYKRPAELDLRYLFNSHSSITQKLFFKKEMLPPDAVRKNYASDVIRKILENDYGFTMFHKYFYSKKVLTK